MASKPELLNSFCGNFLHSLTGGSCFWSLTYIKLFPFRIIRTARPLDDPFRPRPILQIQAFLAPQLFGVDMYRCFGRESVWDFFPSLLWLVGLTMDGEWRLLILESLEYFTYYPMEKGK